MAKLLAPEIMLNSNILKDVLIDSLNQKFGLGNSASETIIDCILEMSIDLSTVLTNYPNKLLETLSHILSNRLSLESYSQQCYEVMMVEAHSDKRKAPLARVAHSGLRLKEFIEGHHLAIHEDLGGCIKLSSNLKSMPELQARKKLTEIVQFVSREILTTQKTRLNEYIRDPSVFDNDSNQSNSR